MGREVSLDDYLARVVRSFTRDVLLDAAERRRVAQSSSACHPAVVVGLSAETKAVCS